MARSRPRVFVCSSSEGLEIADALQALLDRQYEVVVWNQGVFGPGQGILEALVGQLHAFDFGVLVLTADDLVTSRGVPAAVPRDNVLFELGVCVGMLGRDRTFIVHDRTVELKLPTDLAGVVTVTFERHALGNLQSALGAAATQIRQRIANLGSRDRERLNPLSEPEHAVQGAGRAPQAPAKLTSFNGEDDPRFEGTDALLDLLLAGDRMHVVARTCYNWLATDQGRKAILGVISKGAHVTLTVQDLYDRLADREFASLRWHLAAAEKGYWSLQGDLHDADKSRLSLKYSLHAIRNSRTLVLRQQAFSWLRYDLTMAPGPKPFVMIRDAALAKPIIDETLRLERDAMSPKDYAKVKKLREPEERFRDAVSYAARDYQVSSEIRSNSPERLVRQAHLVHKARDGNIPPPVSVQLLLTHACLTHCAMCSCYSRPSSADLAVEQVKRLLDHVADLGTRAVIFSGGEPLLFPGIVEVLEHCSDAALKVGVLTSGVTRAGGAESILDALAANCEWVQLSIDSFQPQTYQAIRDIDGKASRARLATCQSFLAGLRARGMENIEVCYTIQKKNIAEASGATDLARRIGECIPKGVRVRFKFATGVGATAEGEPGHGEFLPTESELLQLGRRWRTDGAALEQAGCNIAPALRMLDTRERAIASGYPVGELRTTLQEARCHVMNHTMFIDSNGDVYPCCYLFNDNVAAWKYRDKYRVANWWDVCQRHADENALARIWRGEKFAQIREQKLKELPHEACGRCTRHMYQNEFLSKLEQAMRGVGEDALDRAVSVFEDLADRRFRPVWL